MTPEREKEIREILSGPEWWSSRMRIEHAAEDLLAEVDRLRRLPVIATCGACGWCSVPRRDGPRHCEHARVPSPPPVVDADSDTPEWCPLRGGSR